ncbi:MAG TPA: EMC3/TMCO1 family protein [Thermoplasmata archaeon]|nr:EMC3/TMCO1 family protein [Thermoplasmata archaeon]
MTDADTPLASGPEASKDEAASTGTAPARPPVPAFKLSTFILTFMFILGLGMLFDLSLRNAVADALGYGLGPLIGFNGHFPLLTMFLAAVLEMFLAAIAYNVTTDWVKVAKTQKWSAAFRKAQMAAMRSGKKDRVDALKPFNSVVTKLAGEMQIAQLKGLAVTWFLLIAIYNWVYRFLAQAPTGGGLAPPHYVVNPIVNLGLGNVSLLAAIAGPVQLWFIVFSLYSVPFSLIFRRLLKHVTLRRHPSLRAGATSLPTPAESTA